MSLFRDFDEVRRQLKLTNAEAANLLGISRRTLSNYSTRSTFPQEVVTGMRVLVYVGEELRKRQASAHSDVKVNTIIKAVMKDLGIPQPLGTKKPLYQFLLLNFSDLKKSIPSPAFNRLPLKRRIVITATTSINQPQNHRGDDDDAALRIKMLLELQNLDSIIQDSCDLKLKLLKGEAELPEPMICIGPPDRNYFTGMLGQNRVAVSRESLKKYYGNLTPKQVVISKVTGKAIYIVFAASDELMDRACRMVVDMITGGVIDLRPGCPDRGQELPPLKWGKPKK